MSQAVYLSAQSDYLIQPSQGGIASDVLGANLKPGEIIAIRNGAAAQVGVSRELWLLPVPLTVSARGNVKLELRQVLAQLGTPGVQIDTDDNGTVTAVDWSGHRQNMRRKGWLRIDPALKAMGIDPWSIYDQPEDVHIERIRPLKSAAFWKAVAEDNDVTYREGYLRKAPHQAADAIRAYLSEMALRSFTPDRLGMVALTQQVKDEMAGWVAAMKGTEAKVETPLAAPAAPAAVDIDAIRAQVRAEIEAETKAKAEADAKKGEAKARAKAEADAKKAEAKALEGKPNGDV